MGRVGRGGSVWGLGIVIVGGAVKEGESGNVTVYREDFSKEIGRVDETGEKYKAEKILAHPLLQPVETHVDRLGLLRANRKSRKANRTFVIDKKQKEGEGTVGGGQGWLG